MCLNACPLTCYFLFSSVVVFFCSDLAVTLWVPNYNFDSRCRCIPSWCCYFNWFIICALAWSVERDFGLWNIWVVILSQSYRISKASNLLTYTPISLGGFSCRRTNLLGLYKLHRGALWFFNGTVEDALWSGSFPFHMFSSLCGIA